ncbi:hypothetical protein CDD83_8641 [Cordyceps sp. RAO-2017]|nr:hypothetical protein CDD83_8641 [Cordyceps sp. RAO-2017]
MPLREDGALTPSANVADEYMPFLFTPPSGDATGIDKLSYFAPPESNTEVKSVPDRDGAGKDAAIQVASRDQPGADLTARSLDQSRCSSLSITADSILTKDYQSYLTALDVSASATVSGWGQSASISGHYLDQARLSDSDLTYVAIIEIQRQQISNDVFKFNDDLYNSLSFTENFGDRWIRGFQSGGKLIARVSIKTHEGAKKAEVEAHAKASLAFWGISGDFSATVKNSMKRLDQHAGVHISIHYQGVLGREMLKSAPENIAVGSAEGSFGQAKLWADRFIERACDHDYPYAALLDSYKTLENFPANQEVVDYRAAKSEAKFLLQDLVKLSEMTTLLRTYDLSDAVKYEIDRAEAHLIEASRTWVENTAIDPSRAEESREILRASFNTTFYAPYRKYLEKRVALYERPNFEGKSIAVTTPTGKCVDVPMSFNDVAASFRLEMTAACRFHTDFGCRGSFFLAWEDEDNLPSDRPEFSDAISSLSCSPSQAREQNERCGPDGGHHVCAQGLCCSKHGYCGLTDAHCVSCQEGFGICSSQPQFDDISRHVQSWWERGEQETDRSDQCRQQCHQPSTWGKELEPFCRLRCDEEEKLTQKEGSAIEDHIRQWGTRGAQQFDICRQDCDRLADKNGRWRRTRAPFCRQQCDNEQKDQESKAIDRHIEYWAGPGGQEFGKCQKDCNQLAGLAGKWRNERVPYCIHRCRLEYYRMIQDFALRGELEFHKADDRLERRISMMRQSLEISRQTAARGRLPEIKLGLFKDIEEFDRFFDDFFREIRQEAQAIDEFIKSWPGSEKQQFDECRQGCDRLAGQTGRWRKKRVPFCQRRCHHEEAKAGGGHIVMLNTGPNDYMYHLELHIGLLQDRYQHKVVVETSLFNVTHKFLAETHGFHGYAGKFSQDIIAYIAELDDVAFVEEDTIMSIPPPIVESESEPAVEEAVDETNGLERRQGTRVLPLTFATQDHAPWNLYAISQRHPPPKLKPNCFFKYYHNSLAGENTYAYVIDTGVLYTHQQFEGRAEHGCTVKYGVQGCSTSPSDATDTLGHGTHVAGIIASKTYGVAKKAKVISVKVFDENGNSPKSATIDAFAWAVHDIRVKGRRDKAVINISAGGGQSDIQNAAINSAFEALGIITVVSAGNDGRPASEKSPASADKAITVGSMRRDWSVDPDSNFGPEVDILAPGQAIVSLSNRHDGAFTTRFGTVAMSGSSMATPHVAGLALYAMSVYGIKADGIKQFLIDTATKSKITGHLQGTENRLANNNNAKQNLHHSEDPCI